MQKNSSEIKMKEKKMFIEVCFLNNAVTQCLFSLTFDYIPMSYIKTLNNYKMQIRKKTVFDVYPYIDYEKGFKIYKIFLNLYKSDYITTK